MTTRGPFHVILVNYQHGEHDYMLCETKEELFNYAIRSWDKCAKDYEDTPQELRVKRNMSVETCVAKMKALGAWISQLAGYGCVEVIEGKRL